MAPDGTYHFFDIADTKNVPSDLARKRPSLLLTACNNVLFRIADDTGVAKKLLSLLFSLAVQEKSVLPVLGELSRDIHCLEGDIDQVEVFPAKSDHFTPSSCQAED